MAEPLLRINPARWPEPKEPRVTITVTLSQLTKTKLELMAAAEGKPRSEATEHYINQIWEEKKNLPVTRQMSKKYEKQFKRAMDSGLSNLSIADIEEIMEWC